MHPDKTEVIMVWFGGTLTASFAVNQVQEQAQTTSWEAVVVIPTHILHNMKGFLGRHRDLSDSYKPCLFISYLQVYLYIFMAPTSFPESHNYHHSEIDVLMVHLRERQG